MLVFKILFMANFNIDKLHFYLLYVYMHIYMSRYKAQLIEDIWGILIIFFFFQQFNEASHACVLQ